MSHSQRQACQNNMGFVGFDLDIHPSTLDEDSWRWKDVTNESVIPADARFAGVMDSRDAVLRGFRWRAFFRISQTARWMRW
jgi:hypothetical protein